MIQKTSELILTAGPTISPMEIEYVMDAAIHGWNLKHSDYIKRFEQSFADYIGVKYAMATSSCTGALHLALLAMGVGPGDEVIVPETTWIATASAVCYVGATPIFADIDADTWVMDPKSVAKLISPKTKVIIPVHLYGQLVDMDPLLELAREHKLRVLEDAAPSIGAEYKGRKTGSFGNAAAFSFQGAKALTTGEGGMLVTDDKGLIDRARFLNDHGRDPNRMLYTLEIAYKYKISNIQAALGLAQIERAEEIVAKKRQIFQWYRERLSDIRSIQLPVESADTRNIFWMSSLVLPKDGALSRDQFMALLKERQIDTRPFFYPISSFSMFKSCQQSNPVAYDVPLRAVNLPSGHERTEEEIDYICAHIREVLGADQSLVQAVQPHGWLAFRDRVRTRLEQIKNSAEAAAQEFDLPVCKGETKIGLLRAITKNSCLNLKCLERLTKWRDSLQHSLPSKFPISSHGTRQWLQEDLLQIRDAVHFFIETLSGESIGHLSISSFDFRKRSCVLQHAVYGSAENWEDTVYLSCRALVDWANKDLAFKSFFVRLMSNDEPTLDLYKSLGFTEIQRTPLRRVEQGNSQHWLEVVGDPYHKVERYFITLQAQLS